MKRYSVPVVYTTVGWIKILAENIDAAKKEARRLNDEGVEHSSIEDSESSSECIVEEIEDMDADEIDD